MEKLMQLQPHHAFFDAVEVAEVGGEVAVITCNPTLQNQTLNLPSSSLIQFSSLHPF